MSETYTGWDGNPYPWPPPEGWYEASDGRWWAPGTGPNPPGAEGPGGVPGATSEPAPAPHQAEPTAIPDDIAQTAQLPADIAGAPPGAGAAAAGVTVASDAAQPSVGNTPPPSLGGPPGGSAGGDWTNQWDQEPASTDGAEGDRGTLAKIGLVLAGVAAALVVAGGAYLLLRDNGSETAADGGDTSTEASTSQTTAGDDANGDSTGDTGGADDGSDTSATTDGSDSSDSTDDDSTETTEDSTSSTEEDSSTTADTSSQVLAFRNILTANGLTSSGLSDDDIATFGTRFCVFAIASEDEAEYQDFRAQAIETTSSELTDDELFTVVDAAVVVFCPDEAARLGIDL
ncbi:MAG: hypothetical protein ACR2QO_17300 [Acidimicrobiales bacterium]